MGNTLGKRTMGSPIAGALANVWLDKLERLILPKYSRYIIQWYRYIDDVLIFTKEENDEVILKLIEEFNNECESIIFNIEQKGVRVHFLDVP